MSRENGGVEESKGGEVPVPQKSPKRRTGVYVPQLDLPALYHVIKKSKK